jgi:hypothetical protein
MSNNYESISLWENKRKPEATGPGVRKPKTTTHDEEKKQQ